MLKHLRKVGMKAWDHLKRYKKLYNLYPYDGFQLLAFVLNNHEHGVLEEMVYRAVGGEEQDVADGWRAIHVFIKCLTITTTNWGEITKCVQKPKELFVEFEERFRAEVGYLTWKMKTLNSSKNGAITHQLMQSIHNDLQKTFVSSTNDWDRQNYSDIIDRLSRLDRDINQHNKPAVIIFVQVPSETNNIICSVKEKPGECHYCGIFW
jgi:heme oxygenase